jgi:hypothetical protein
MRKNPPRFAGVDLPGHFLKHADEQTVLALHAIRCAVERFNLDPRQQDRWGILGAPRFIARMAGAQILTRYVTGGGPTVPPHALAQNSLHSISGAASIALGIHGPNVGVGGGPGAIFDALTAAVTLFDPAECPGVWLLMTQWDPEPMPDGAGGASNEPVCHAAALALRLSAAGDSWLRINPLPNGMAGTDETPEPAVAEIAAAIEHSLAGQPACWTCQLPWGANAELQLAAQTAVRSAAA